MLDPDGDRVRKNTSVAVNEQIDREIRERIEYYSKQPKAMVSRRIQELEREWDMERVLECNASSIALSGAVLGYTVNKKWLFLTFGVLGFLLLHAVQGWCPPVPLLRRMGVRTCHEIDREKFALKVLRGDFREVGKAGNEAPADELAMAVKA